jgi:hypothetical protein
MSLRRSSTILFGSVRPSTKTPPAFRQWVPSAGGRKRTSSAVTLVPPGTRYPPQTRRRRRVGYSVRSVVLAAFALGLSSCTVLPPPILMPPPMPPLAPPAAPAVPSGAPVPPPPLVPNQTEIMNAPSPVFPPPPGTIDLCATGYHWELGNRLGVRSHCAPNQPSPGSPPPR